MINMLSSYADFINSSIFRYLRTYGVTIFLILISILSRMNFMSWKSWKKSFMILPIFTYDFGTMFLLSGSDSRFFLITFLVAPLMIAFSFMENRL